LQFDPIGKAKYDTLSCDIVQRRSSQRRDQLRHIGCAGGQRSEIRIGEAHFTAPEPSSIADQRGGAAVSKPIRMQ